MRLAHVVLGRTLDELPPQTRTLLLEIDRMVVEGCAREGMARQDYRFDSRDWGGDSAVVVRFR